MQKGLAALSRCNPLRLQPHHEQSHARDDPRAFPGQNPGTRSRLQPGGGSLDLGGLIDPRTEFRQELVGLFFLIEGLTEQLFGAFEAEDFCPGA